MTLKQKKRLQIKRLSIRFCSTINFYNWWGYFYKKLNQFKIWKKNQVATSKSFGLKISKQAFPLKENNCLESLKPFWWCNFMQKIRSMSSFSSLEHLNNPHFGPILGSICYINPKTRISSKWFYQYPAFLWLQLHAKKKEKKKKKKRKRKINASDPFGQKPKPRFFPQKSQFYEFILHSLYAKDLAKTWRT